MVMALPPSFPGTSGRSGGMRAGRVLSRQSPVTPSSPNRSCQRQITVLALPVARMMSEAITPLSERLKVNFALIDQNIANQILWLVSHAPSLVVHGFFL